MDLIVNGNTEAGDFSTVSELLASRDILPETVVVELNGKILPKADYNNPLKEGDTVELVQFVAGG